MMITYHSVLPPVSDFSWYSGNDGTTVGIGLTALVASGMVAMAWTGSTIMVTGAQVYRDLG